MKKTFLAITILLATLTSATLTSCNDDDGDSSSSFLSFVTFMGNLSEGAQFQYQASGDSPIITLQANQSIQSSNSDDPFTAGDRMVISYTISDDQYFDASKAGTYDITLTGGMKVPTITFTPEDVADIATAYPQWKTDCAIQIYSFHRSGNFMNLYALVPYDLGENFEIKLVMDESTRNSATPNVYLVHNYSQSLTSTSYYYACFNISYLLSTYDSFNLYISNTSNPSQTYLTISRD
ncbi:MAG: hypothetical protein LIO90_07710 [Bacteroidales bacterium]|nr:hypothetical protein [Bacteroidales bacterium]